MELSFNQIIDRVLAIKEASLKKDHETTHGLEDQLREDFLRTIAEAEVPTDHVRAAAWGVTLIACARLVLSTSSMKFERWTA